MSKNHISIERAGDKLLVDSPYCDRFVSRARSLGGRWAGGQWRFDARNEDLVREALIEFYGTDGNPDEELVSARVTYPDGCSVWHGNVQILGRPLARATGRDSGATIGDGVALVAGSINSGGSVKNWRTVAEPGTVFLVHDLPRAAIKRLAAKLAADPESLAHVEVLVPQSATDESTLRQERERLLARVTEIDQLLAGGAAEAAPLSPQA